MGTFHVVLDGTPKPFILTRTSGRCARLRGRWTTRAGHRFLRTLRCVRGGRSAHGGGHTLLLFRSELKDVIHEQLGVILVIALERWRRRSGKHPVVVDLGEQAGRHGSAGTDRWWIGDPAFHAVG